MNWKTFSMYYMRRKRGEIMIRIKPYNELSQKEEIFNLYLYLVSNAMPFYPEDIFPEGYYYRDGKVKTDISKYIRQPRNRTKNYIKILEK